MEGLRRRKGGHGGGGGGGGHRYGVVEVEEGERKHLLDSEAFWDGRAQEPRGGAQEEWKNKYDEKKKEEQEEEEEEEDKPEFPSSNAVALRGGQYFHSYYGVMLMAASATLKWFYDLLPSWNAFSTLLWSTPQQQFPITPAMQQRVDAFKAKIAVAYSDEEATHVAALEEYWALAFPGEQFERKTKRWTDVGFQSDDPGRDFRGAGICGLQVWWCGEIWVPLNLTSPKKAPLLLCERTSSGF